MQVANCEDKGTFYNEVPKWDRTTKADGEAMGEVIERLYNNSLYNKAAIERAKHTEPVTLLAAGWTGEAAPYTQTVSAEGVTEADEPSLVSMLEDGADASTQEAYNEAFALIAAGTGETGNGTVTFKVYEKPGIDVTVGLKGV